MVGMRYLILLCLLAGPVAAQDACPPAPDHAAARDDILRRLAVARDATEARFLADELWVIWLDAPDAAAQDMLDRGMARRDSFDFEGAWDILDGLVEYCPDYAEGWNQRAFASFLREDYAAALNDLDRAIEIDPRHVAALSGRALTLIGMGRDAEGQQALREALRLNPWLSERALLTGEPEVEL